MATRVINISLRAEFACPGHGYSGSDKSPPSDMQCIKAVDKILKSINDLPICHRLTIHYGVGEVRTGSLVKVRIEHDSDVDSPFMHSDWEMFSFNRHHCSYKDPSNVFVDKPEDDYDGMTEDLGEWYEQDRQLKEGEMFLLSYREHCNCLWKVCCSGDCSKALADHCGVLIYRSNKEYLPETLKEREKLADSLMEEYTQWCNGECYYYSIVSEDDVDIDSCGGCIGGDSLVECVADVLACHPDIKHVVFSKGHDSVEESFKDEILELWKKKLSSLEKKETDYEPVDAQGVEEDF